MNKFAKFVESELKRIAFFLQYASVIEDYIPSKRTQDQLMSLPVDWDNDYVKINKKDPEDTNENDFFYGKGYRSTKLPVDIELRGSFGERDFSLKIIYGDSVHYYKLNFDDGVEYKNRRSMKLIGDIFRSLGDPNHVDKDLTSLFSDIYKNKEKRKALKDDLINKFFKDYSNINWNVKANYLKNRGYITYKLYATGATSKEFSEVYSLFTDDDPNKRKPTKKDLVTKEIPYYINSKLKDAGYDVDVSVKGDLISPNIGEGGELSGTLGFTITIE